VQRIFLIIGAELARETITRNNWSNKLICRSWNQRAWTVTNNKLYAGCSDFRSSWVEFNCDIIPLSPSIQVYIKPAATYLISSSMHSTKNSRIIFIEQNSLRSHRRSSPLHLNTYRTRFIYSGSLSRSFLRITTTRK